MKRTFSVLFFVKRSRVTKNGEVAIQLKVTVNKEKIEVSINQTIKPDLWNSSTEKATGKDRKSLEINSRLDSIRFRLMEIYREMEINGEDISARKIVNKYKGIETESKITLLTIFQEHNERCHKLEDKDMSRSTIMRYETAYRHTQEFIQFQYKKDDVDIEEVNYQFIKDYEFFLKTERDCNHNSTMKYLKNFKKIIRIALANEWLKKDPFMNFKMTYEEVEREFLEYHELEKIIQKEFEIERLANVRDILVFCCFTNLEDKKQRKANQGNELIVRNERPLVALSA